AALAHCFPVNECGCVTRNEDKDFRRVAKPVIADRDPADDVRWNMIEENEPKCDPAEQVESQIAAGCGHHGRMHWKRSFLRRSVILALLPGSGIHVGATTGRGSATRFTGLRYVVCPHSLQRFRS